MATLQAVRPLQGYANHFEYRPEFLFDNFIAQVIDASVRERATGDLMVARIEDVFDSASETFMVFGKPNTALVTPKADGSGYQKFAAYSIWRQASEVVDVTRGSGSFVQSGIWLRFLDLPLEAQAKLREAMVQFSGRKFRTCVNANMQVLEYAGFSSGETKLSNITWPYQLMNTLLKNNLYFQGTRVHFEVVRTTRLSMESYTRRIMWAEVTTPYRHFKRNRVGASVDYVLKSLTKKFGRNKTRRAQPYEVAPALPTQEDYLRGIAVRVTSATPPGQLLRQMWGPHALFEALIERVNIDNYLIRPLRSFPQKNPSFATKVKKAILFSRPVIWTIRRVMGASAYVQLGECSERDVYDMLRTHSNTSSNKYNLVAVRTPSVKPYGQPLIRLILSRVTVKTKLVDWILSKHVLMSGYLWAPQDDQERPDTDREYVVWAGETWKNPFGVLMVSGNSGTYRPTDREDQAMVEMMRKVLPHLRIERVAREG